jgi:hypothetical protein
VTLGCVNEDLQSQRYIVQELTVAKKRKDLNKRAIKEQVSQVKKQIAQRTKRVLFLLSTFLIAICLVLLLKIGVSVWPAWLMAHRTQVIGILLLGIIITIVSLPVIIEVNTNPRPLSGSESPPSE